MQRATLPAGTKLGPYEILAALGAGAMGEIYRARDPRLGREVAIKVLPSEFAADSERVRRFEQEARAAGVLNHPNVVQLYDVGIHEQAPYLVMELLEGQTLRERMRQSAIPPRRTLDYALQIARGLAAAHEKGIVHRDLKPENVFLTRDGRVKILDFGLARLTQSEGEGEDRTSAETVPGGKAPGYEQSREPTRIPGATEPGTMLGTVGYMAPEQVRGRAADARSDIFSLGSILYEMAAGRPAFQGETAIEVLNAILKEEPELPENASRFSPAIERVVRYCLEKTPEQRFQSARDVALALEAVSMPSTLGSSPRLLAPGRTASRLWLSGAALVVVAALVAAAFLAGQRVARPVPAYKQLTFRRGSVVSARFTADGHTIVYSASWDGRPVQIFTVRPESPESRPLDFQDAQLLAVSPSGEVAILLGRHFTLDSAFVTAGTLARVPLVGGAPREILENVEHADWSPDGQELAVVHEVEGRSRLEFPIGRTLYETGGWIGEFRISPRGDAIAFLDHPSRGDNGGRVMVVGLDGKTLVLADGWVDAEGLCWSRSGREVWFTAVSVGGARALHAVTLAGRARLLARVPGTLTIHDIAPDGRVLLGRDTVRVGIISLAPGETKERDLSWFDWSGVFDLSNDGRTILFVESSEAGGELYSSYLRRTDGAPAVRLGDGSATALSPDGKWALSMLKNKKLQLLPTGTGSVRTLPAQDGSFMIHWARFFPDGKRVLFAGSEPGHGVRMYEQAIAGGAPQPLTPEGYGFLGWDPLTPDASQMVLRDPEGRVVLFPVHGKGPPKAIPGLDPSDQPIRFAADGQTLFVAPPGQFPARVYRVDVKTGKKDLLREIVPPDPAGVISFPGIYLTPDGKNYAASYLRVLSDLYQVEGLR